jgi:hypothetical protein
MKKKKIVIFSRSIALFTIHSYVLCKMTLFFLGKDLFQYYCWALAEILINMF